MEIDRWEVTPDVDGKVKVFPNQTCEKKLFTPKKQCRLLRKIGHLLGMHYVKLNIQHNCMSS